MGNSLLGKSEKVELIQKVSERLRQKTCVEIAINLYGCSESPESFCAIFSGVGRRLFIDSGNVFVIL